MAFTPPTEPFNLARIKATLLTSGVQKDKPALYQTLNQMIDQINNQLVSLDARITKLENP